MTIAELTQMLAEGLFDHATYREIGSIWEGLWIYARNPNGFRGYSVAGCFNRDSPDLKAAEALVRGSGVSVGAFGRG